MKGDMNNKAKIVKENGDLGVLFPSLLQSLLVLFHIQRRWQNWNSTD